MRKVRQGEELCKSFIKGLASHSRERRAIWAAVGEDDQRVQCIDDITGKELPWSQVRQAPEQDLTYFCAISECARELMNVKLLCTVSGHFI